MKSRNSSGSGWSGWGDSNPRPLGPEPSALPAALQPAISSRESSVCGLESGMSLANLSSTSPKTAWSGRQRETIDWRLPLKNFGKLVGATGFEPATLCTPCKCSTRLSHAPIDF